MTTPSTKPKRTRRNLRRDKVQRPSSSFPSSSSLSMLLSSFSKSQEQQQQQPPVICPKILIRTNWIFKVRTMSCIISCCIVCLYIPLFFYSSTSSSPQSIVPLFNEFEYSNMDSMFSTGRRRRRRKIITVFYHTFANPNKILSSNNQNNITKGGGGGRRRRSSSSIGGAESILTKEQTMSIISEQMEQIVNAANATRDKYDWNVRFASVGEANVIDASWILSTFCQTNSKTTITTTRRRKNKVSNLRCQYLGHELYGHEEITLQQMHNFCQKSNPNNIVIYIHTKGTYHSYEANHEWRRMLTKAVLTESCIQSLINSNDDHHHNHSSSSFSCDVCGLQFYPIWITMFPGNFFATKCSYVRQLLPLHVHGKKMTNIIQSIKRTRKQIWTTSLYPWQNDILGTGRWSKESWIASHPSLQPCDLAGNVTKLFLQLVSTTTTTTTTTPIHQRHVLPAPRISVIDGDWYRRKLNVLKRILSQQQQQEEQNSNNQMMINQRPHEYFLLPGQLYRYYKLYQQFPPTDSWVWKWYPQGQQWKEKIQQLLLIHSNNTTTTATNQNGSFVVVNKGKFISIKNESILW